MLSRTTSTISISVYRKQSCRSSLLCYLMRLMHCSKLLVTSMTQPCSYLFLSGASSTCTQTPRHVCSPCSHFSEEKPESCLPQRSRQRSQRWPQLWPELRSFRPDRRSQTLAPSGRRCPGTSGLRSAQSAAPRGMRKHTVYNIKHALICILYWKLSVSCKPKCHEQSPEVRCSSNSLLSFDRTCKSTTLELCPFLSTLKRKITHIDTPSANIFSYWSLEE